MVLLIDCKPALQFLEKARSPQVPGERLAMWAQMKCYLEFLRSCGVEIHTGWVSSHGKRPDWPGIPGVVPRLARALNGKADEVTVPHMLAAFKWIVHSTFEQVLERHATLPPSARVLVAEASRSELRI